MLSGSCSPANPVELFNNHMDWVDDFQKAAQNNHKPLSERQLRTLVIIDIQQRLQSWDRDLKTFRLPEPTEEELNEISSNKINIFPVVIREELNFDMNQMQTIAAQRIGMFTKEQMDVFETVMAAVKNEIALAMFIDARGGTGKTFVLNPIKFGWGGAQSSAQTFRRQNGGF